MLPAFSEARPWISQRMVSSRDMVTEKHLHPFLTAKPATITRWRSVVRNADSNRQRS